MDIRIQRQRIAVEMESEIVLDMEALTPNPDRTVSMGFYVLPFNDQSLQLIVLTEEYTEEEILAAQTKAQMLGLTALEQLDGDDAA